MKCSPAGHRRCSPEIMATYLRLKEPQYIFVANQGNSGTHTSQTYIYCQQISEVRNTDNHKIVNGRYQKNINLLFDFFFFNLSICFSIIVSEEKNGLHLKKIDFNILMWSADGFKQNKK